MPNTESAYDKEEASLALQLKYLINTIVRKQNGEATREQKNKIIQLSAQLRQLRKTGGW